MPNTLSPEAIIDHILNVIRDDDKLRRRFSPLAYKAIAEKCGFEANEPLWLSTLSKLTQSGTLLKNFELVDPVSRRTINIYHSMRDIPLDEIYSETYPFVVSPHDVFITYSFVEAETNVTQA